MSFRSGRIQALAVSLTAFAVYAATLAPDITWANFGGDGGELITAAVTTGIPHPPGYPTFIILGKLISLIPIGSAAFRFNLLSAAAVSTAAGLVSAIQIEKQAKGEYWAVASGLMLAFAPLVWGQAIITEVYGLNLLFLAVFLWSLLGKRPSLVTGLFLGISITSHLSSLIMVPLALSLTPRRDWVSLSFGTALGMTPLAMLPIFARGNSPVLWGDATTFSGWWWLISGQLYGDNLFAISNAGLVERLKTWGPALLNQFTWAGLPLMLYALAASRKEERRVESRLLGTAVIFILFAFGYRANDAIIFTLPALLLLSLLLRAGLQQLGNWALLLPLILLLLNYNAIDLSADRSVRLVAEGLLESLPDNAVVLTPGDQAIFALWYFHHVERQRSDMALVDANLFAFDWYRRRLSRIRPLLDVPENDDLAAFQRLNEPSFPICRVSIQPQVNHFQLNCNGQE